MIKISYPKNFALSFANGVTISVSQIANQYRTQHTYAEVLIWHAEKPSHNLMPPGERDAVVHHCKADRVAALIQWAAGLDPMEIVNHYEKELLP